MAPSLPQAALLLPLRQHAAIAFARSGYHQSHDSTTGIGRRGRVDRRADGGVSIVVGDVVSGGWLGLAAAVALDAWLLQPAATPIVIAHRGASGHRPEHTIEAYTLAIEMGADVIEPDLVSTKDGVLIARHENEIGGTTDVSVKFPDRQTTKTIDGTDVTGWFTEDLTLAEIKTLRARERLEFRSHAYDGQFAIPTFDEVLSLASKKSAELGRPIGVYPETKHPTYFRGIGLPIEDRLLAALRMYGLTEKTSPVFVQSFEPSSLRYLRPRTAVRLVQLTDRAEDVTPEKLTEIATYADGVGVEKKLVIPVDENGNARAPTSLVRDAHAAALFVHVWTLRREPRFLPASYHGDLAAEVRRFVDAGIDGLFTDFPDVAAGVIKGKHDGH
jgi:glycerophosphoryl diester phosphodiesterase